MADLNDRQDYNGEYSGLLSSLYLTLGLGGLCLIGFETLRHVPRRRGLEGPKPPKDHHFLNRNKHRRPVYVDTSNKENKVFNRNYWKLGKRERLTPDEGDHELQERQRASGFETLGKAAYREDVKERVGLVERILGSREGWEFSYLYENRCWNAINPAEPLPKWPLVWIWSIIMFPERNLPDRVGLDCTAHSRFLRGSLWYITLHLCTTMVVLTPLHLFYAPDEIGGESMNKAGISVSSQSGEKRWLWVHIVLLYWMVLTWLANLVWVIWGVLMYRKEDIRKRAVALESEFGSSALPNIQEEPEGEEMIELLQERKTSIGPQHEKPNLQRSDLVDATQAEGTGNTNEPGKQRKFLGLDAPGWKRYRTIMVTNIPPAMRDEKHLRFYFAEHLHKAAPPRAWKHAVPQLVKRQVGRAQAVVGGGTPRNSMDVNRDALGAMVVGISDVAISTAMSLKEAENTIVEDVVLVRKLGELGRLRQRRDEVVKQLELAHVRLAQRVMKDLHNFRTTISSTSSPSRSSLEKLRSSDEDGLIGKNVLLTALEPFMPGFQGHYREAVTGETVDSVPNTVWEALLSVPREYLDPYQTFAHRFDGLHKDNPPLIDYLTAKLAILTEKLQHAKKASITEYRPASTAFVTFRTAALARRALSELPSSELYPLGCQTRPCPHYSDIIWPRLSKSVYRADVLRGWVIAILLFFTTIVWIFPVGAFVSLASITNIAKIFPTLADYLGRHQRLASFITNTVPVVLVAALSLSICPLLLLVGNKAETLITGYEVHNTVIHRNWIFQICNIVIFFVIGKSGVTAYITSRFQPNTILQNVANAFPAAAPYYASYFLLQTTIQSMAELARVGLPLIFYIFSMRKAATPRIRDGRIAYSTVSWFIQLPNAILALAISNLFCLYNPLVLPFCYVYLFCAHVVYRRSYLYVYGRRYENNGKRNSIRYLRYSLDALFLTCFSMLAFMILAKEKALAALSGVLLPIIVFIKIGLTRIVKARFARLRTQEADHIDILRRKTKNVEVDKETKEMEESWVWRSLAQPCRFLDRWFTLKVDESRNSTLRLEKEPIMPHNVTSGMVPVRTTGEPETITIHVYNPYWDDLPSPSRMQTYAHQPWHADSIETFLWLPRDPMSTLDLEDTVEMRACITTSETDINDIWEETIDIEKMLGSQSETFSSESNLSGRIGTAVDDDDDMADDPEISLVHRINHRLHRLTRSERTNESEDPEAGRQPGSTHLARQHAVRRRSRGRSVGTHPGSNILLAAQREERAAERKAMDAEAKELEAETKRQQDGVSGVRRWKTLYRSNKRSELVQNSEGGIA